MPAVSVIVPARDAAATIGATLAALARQEVVEGGYEVIVVDNGSHDATVQIAEQAGAQIVRRERGEGPGAARNAGAVVATAPLLAFTDADCVPAPRWLAEGVAALTAADLVQGRVEPDPDAAIGPFDRTLSVTAAWGLFESANLFVRRDLFVCLGGFGGGLESVGGPPFGEDVLFGWRAVRGGARSAFCHEALVHHAVFSRHAPEYLSERRREGLFPAVVGHVPELRDTFLYKRVFLTRRGAMFWLGVAGVAGGLATRRALPLAAVLPYARMVSSDRRYCGMRVAAIRAAGDAIAAAERLRGSIAARTLVL